MQKYEGGNVSTDNNIYWHKERRSNTKYLKERKYKIYAVSKKFINPLNTELNPICQ